MEQRRVSNRPSEGSQAITVGKKSTVPAPSRSNTVEQRLNSRSQQSPRQSALPAAIQPSSNKTVSASKQATPLKNNLGNRVLNTAISTNNNTHAQSSSGSQRYNFTSQKFDKHKQANVLSLDKGSKPSGNSTLAASTSHFVKCYHEGSIPCRIDHGSVNMYLKWQEHPRGMQRAYSIVNDIYVVKFQICHLMIHY